MKRFAIALTFVLAATGVQAQTNDHLWRSWGFRSVVSSPRAAGLGGAFVAVADDDALTFVNPAGLTSLTKSALSGNVLSRKAAILGNGDLLASGTGPGYVGGAGLLGPKIAIGGYFIRPGTWHSTMAPFGLPDGSVDSGSLQFNLTEIGGAFAWRATSHVSLGARITATHLELEGDYSRDVRGVIDRRTGTASGSTRITGSLGVAVEAGDLRLALVAHPGASYRADRTATDPSRAEPLDLGSEYDVRQPSVVSTGLAYQVNTKVLVTAQVDYVRYSEVEFIPRQAAAEAEDYEVADALEPRAGIEVSIPFRRFSLQVRGGVHSQAPAAARFAGNDAVEAMSFAGTSRVTRVSLGGSMVLRAFRFETAALVGGEQDMLLAGVGLRF